MTIWDDTADSTKELMFTALDYALENAQLSDQPFTPFSFARHSDGTATLTRFAVPPGADVPETLDAARAHLETAEPGTTAITLAYDGYTTYEGERTEAVFIETHQATSPAPSSSPSATSATTATSNPSATRCCRRRWLRWYYGWRRGRTWTRAKPRTTMTLSAGAQVRIAGAAPLSVHTVLDRIGRTHSPVLGGQCRSRVSSSVS